MGLIMKNGNPYGGSGDTASNISYDATSSGLPVSTVQSAIDYLNENGIGKADTEGIIVNVEIGNWIEQSDGTFTNTITVSEVTAKDIYDVSLYGDFSEEQAEAFDFLVSSIDTLNGKVVLTASEQIDVAFSIILRGKVNLENKNVYVSDLSATSIEYDNSKSRLDATNMQNAMDEVATMVNGIVVNITADSWDLQDDGTYKKIVALEQITGNETLDVCLYPGDAHTNEQIVAFSELVTSIDTAEGMIILTAVEEINVSFRIFLYGKVNFNKNNLVALTDSVIEIRKISEEEFKKLSDAEKAAGNYLVDDGEDDEFLSARNIEFDGSEIGIDADNVHDAISELKSDLQVNNDIILDLQKNKFNDFGAAINISSYTSVSNHFTVPSDGYVRWKSTTANHAILTLLRSDLTTVMGFTTDNIIHGHLFVKAGMKMYLANSSGYEAVFVPIV